MITLKDIAHKAGVNVSTVSRALNDSYEVSEKMKQKIRGIAEDLNYTPNMSARALVGKSTDSIGLILPEVRSNYYAQITNSIEEEFQKHGYSIIISLTEFESKQEVKSLEVLAMRKVDGILFTGATSGKTKEMLDKVSAYYEIPVVLLDAIKRIKGYDHVVIDTQGGIEEAVAHCTNRGIKSFGFISDGISDPSRFTNYLKALEKHSLKVDEKFTVLGTDRFEEGGYRGMKELLSLSSTPECVFAAYDDMAIGALKAIYEAGLKVPEDIMVFGYDNIREGEYLFKSLSTIHAPIEEMARIGVNLILDRIRGEYPADRPERTVQMKTNFIARATT